MVPKKKTTDKRRHGISESISVIKSKFLDKFHWIQLNDFVMKEATNQHSFVSNNQDKINYKINFI